jgi:hypothetical protein
VAQLQRVFQLDEPYITLFKSSVCNASKEPSKLAKYLTGDKQKDGGEAPGRLQNLNAERRVSKERASRRDRASRRS